VGNIEVLLWRVFMLAVLSARVYNGHGLLLKLPLLLLPIPRMLWLPALLDIAAGLPGQFALLGVLGLLGLLALFGLLGLPYRRGGSAGLQNRPRALVLRFTLQKTLTRHTYR